MPIEADRAWLQAHTSGAAQVNVHLGTDPDHSARMHFLDVTEWTGAFLGVFPSDAAEPGEDRRGVVEQRLTPRLAVLRRDARSVIVDADQASSLLLGHPARGAQGRAAVRDDPSGRPSVDDRPAGVAGIPVVPGGSVGVAWARGGTGSAQELIAAADRAMYRSKKSRRCTPG
jgi:hypothetical protein